METTKSVTEIFDEASPTDATETFEQLWTMMGGLRDRVLDRFSLTPDPGVEPVSKVGGDTGPRGILDAWTGPGVDWMINSWIGDAEAGFTNMHLTVWLGPGTNVPHLGMAWGTLPSLWCFIDLLPRADLFTDLDYVDTYYEPINAEYMALKSDPGASAFVSQDTFTRVGVSQSALCSVFPSNQERIDQIARLADLRVSQWLDFLDNAPATDPADREALAARDLAMRRNIAERDPANALAERFFGADLTNRLVRALWGGDRMLPRPTE